MMEVKHIGEPHGVRFGQAKHKLEEFGALVFLAFGQEGLEPYVSTIAIEPKNLSSHIVDVSVKVTVKVDTFGLKAEEVVPKFLQLNIDPEYDIVGPTRMVVDGIRTHLALVATDARRLASSLSHFEKAAAA